MADSLESIFRDLNSTFTNLASTLFAQNLLLKRFLANPQNLKDYENLDNTYKQFLDVCTKEFSTNNLSGANTALDILKNIYSKLESINFLFNSENKSMQEILNSYQNSVDKFNKATDKILGTNNV